MIKILFLEFPVSYNSVALINTLHYILKDYYRYIHISFYSLDYVQ